MATLKAFLDTRRQNRNGRFPLKISISVSRAITIQFPMKIYLAEDEWNAASCRVVKHEDKALYNIAIQERILEYDKKLCRIELSRQIDCMSVREVRSYLLSPEESMQAREDFVAYYQAYIGKIKRPSTQRMHEHTFKKIQEYDAGKLSFRDIDRTWVEGFEHHLSQQHLDARGRQICGIRKLTPNGINLHLRNLRAVFNDAIAKGKVDANIYPFRKYELPYEEPQKLALSVKDLRTIRDYPAEEYCQRYLDVFMLSFYLIGINIGDLLLLRPNNFVAGRVEFNRQKTGKHYSIKVEPEALEIINRWKGKKYLLSFMDNRDEYISFLHVMNKRLKEFGPVNIGKQGKKTKIGLFPFLRSYYARDTWATIASLIDIPEDTIAAALGHGSTRNVTRSYISFNVRKIDIANRMVLDFVASKMSEEEILLIKAVRMQQFMSFNEKFGMGTAFALNIN